MVVIARALSHAFGSDADTENLKIIVMFSGVGLTVSLLLASYGLDLGAGFQ